MSVNPDSELLALCAEWHVAYLSGHDKSISEEEMDARSIIADDFMWRITDIPALTVSGVLAKLAVLAYERKMSYPNQTDSDYEDADDALLIAIYRDGERLSGLSL